MGKSTLHSNDILPALDHYIKSPNDFKDKWRDYSKLESLVLNESQFKDELTPFYGLPEYDDLSSEQKKSLFFEYTKFLSEVQIYFEQLVIYAFSCLRNQYDLDAKEKMIVNKFIYEEVYHSLAFKDFLSQQTAFNWPANRNVPKLKFLRNIICWCIKKAPLSVTLPGAKLEAFTVEYSKWVRLAYKDDEPNSWSLINHYHHLDEAHHVGVEVYLYKKFISEKRPFLTALNTLVFIAFLQVVLFSGCFNMIKYSFPDSGLRARIKLTLRLGKWAVRDLIPYRNALKVTQRNLNHYKPRFHKFFSFIYW